MFLGHIFESILTLDVRVVINRITKSFQLKIDHSATVKELKYLIFHMKFKFQEKLSSKLAQHSKCICKSRLLSDKKKLKELDLDPKYFVKVFIQNDVSIWNFF